MTSTFQILRIDDSIVRKLDLKVGVNAIGNNLNPPLEGETIISQAVEINLLPTGEMSLTTQCEGISCYFKSYHSRSWKLLETNTTIPLNPGDTCHISPLKIWFKIMHSTSNEEEKVNVKRKMEENLETEPPDKKCCLENTTYTEPSHNISTENENLLLVQACSENNNEKSEKNNEIFQRNNNLCDVRDEEKKPDCFPEVSDNTILSCNLEKENEIVPSEVQNISVKPKNQNFKVKSDHHYKKKDKQTKKSVFKKPSSKFKRAKINHSISSGNNNSNAISLATSTSTEVKKKQKFKCKDPLCRMRIQHEKKENHYKESQSNSLNKPLLSINSQPKSKHKYTHKKSSQSKLVSSFTSSDSSPRLYLDDDSNDFNTETSISGEDECHESYFLIDDNYDKKTSSQLKKL